MRRPSAAFWAALAAAVHLQWPAGTGSVPGLCAAVLVAALASAVFRLASQELGGGVPDGAAVLVTGASSGIGRETALRLASEGVHVLAGVRSQEDGDRLVLDGAAAGGRVSPVLLDVTRAEHLGRLEGRVRALLAADERLWGVVCNAGVSCAGAVETVPLDEARRCFDVNVWGALGVARAALPLLREAGRWPGGRGGRLVFVSSVVGLVAVPYLGVYSASKHALEAAADALRVELAAAGDAVGVTLVEPGSFHTRFVEKTFSTEASRGPGAAALRRVATESEARGAVPHPRWVARQIRQVLVARAPPARAAVGLEVPLVLPAAALLPDRVFGALLRFALRRV